MIFPQMVTERPLPGGGTTTLGGGTAISGGGTPNFVDSFICHEQKCKVV